MSILKTAALVASLALAGAADATTVSYTSNTVGPQATSFFDLPVTLQQFDPALGTLQSIKITLLGTVSGNLQAESLDNSAATLLAQLSTLLTLSRPDSSALVSTTASSSQSFNASAYDGTIDFGGTSGFSSGPLSSSSSNAITLTSASDLSLFTGTGSIAALLTALGASSVSGAGNIISQIATNAAGTATIEYTFLTDGVPEAATWAMMVVGFGFAGSALRRRARTQISFG